jgi:hypothetical protein
MLKKIVLIIFIILLSRQGSEQPKPKIMNVQGVLKNKGGEVVDGVYTLTFKIYPTKSASTPLWNESILNVNIKSGLFNVVIGEGVKFPDSMYVSYTELWMGITVGINPELPRERISWSGFAFHSEHATLAEMLTAPPDDLKCSQCVDNSEVSFYYAGSASKGGVATAANAAYDLQCSGQCVSSDEVEFYYAGGVAKGGAATMAKNIDCDLCVQSKEVDFQYAAGDAKGGSALVANSAKALNCTACVTGDQIHDNTITKEKIYSIPPATTAVVGGVQIGSFLDITTQGLLSVKTGITSYTVSKGDHNHDSAYIPLNGGMISGSYTFLGEIQANKFSGDGSGLTKLSLPVVPKDTHALILRYSSICNALAAKLLTSMPKFISAVSPGKPGNESSPKWKGNDVCFYYVDYNNQQDYQCLKVPVVFPIKYDDIAKTSHWIGSDIKTNAYECGDEPISNDWFDPLDGTGNLMACCYKTE